MTRNYRWSSPWMDSHGQFSRVFSIKWRLSHICFNLGLVLVFQRWPVSQTGQRGLVMAGVTGFAAELILCLLSLYHKLSPWTRYNANSASSLFNSRSRNTVNNKDSMMGCWAEGFKKKEKVAHRLPFWCFPSDFFIFRSSEECLHGVRLTEYHDEADDPFLTFNMEVSCVVFDIRG